MRRGELRSYTRPPSPDTQRTVLLVSSDGINDSPRPWLLGIELRERDPGDLLGASAPPVSLPADEACRDQGRPVSG